MVYEGHIYPFWNQVTDFEYEDMVPIMIFLQTYVQESNRTNPTPFWMGEFGTNVDSEEWRKIIRFLQEFDLDWAYWPIDGYEFGLKGDESYGILLDDFSTVRHDWKLKQLQEIMAPNSTAAAMMFHEVHEHEPCL